MTTPANTGVCVHCGAVLTADYDTCEAYFHQMSIWELEYLLYDVHNLMVLGYYLQHPHLYSPQALRGAQWQLITFVEQGATIQEMRQQIGKVVDSGGRKFKIKGTPESHGEYAHPVRWTMTVADVIAGGMDAYYNSVRAWARSILADLRESGNFDPVAYS
jgi:hypothetical protein